MDHGAYQSDLARRLRPLESIERGRSSRKALRQTLADLAVRWLCRGLKKHSAILGASYNFTGAGAQKTSRKILRACRIQPLSFVVIVKAG